MQMYWKLTKNQWKKESKKKDRLWRASRWNGSTRQTCFSIIFFKLIFWRVFIYFGFLSAPFWYHFKWFLPFGFHKMPKWTLEFPFAAQKPPKPESPEVLGPSQSRPCAQRPPKTTPDHIFIDFLSIFTDLGLDFGGFCSILCWILNGFCYNVEVG